jgi:hypothetical protein
MLYYVGEGGCLITGPLSTVFLKKQNSSRFRINIKGLAQALASAAAGSGATKDTDCVCWLAWTPLNKA